MKTAINLMQLPNQQISALISDINSVQHMVDIKLRTMRDNSLIADLQIDQKPIFYGRRCINKMPLMLGGSISGNFYFLDQYENTDPVYTGLGDQYLLIYDDEYTLG